MEPRGIPRKESLIVEFKSDQKKIADTDLVLAVVGMANADGGDIYLGVEDDATVTGVHPEHQSVTGLAAMIANRTNPPVSVRVEALTADGSTVVR
jgi:ATP-dependent DNA helicase RecG